MKRSILPRALALALCASAAAGCADGDSTVPGAPNPANPSGTPDARDAAARSVLADLRSWDAATAPVRRAAAEFVAERSAGFRFVGLQTFSCGGATHETAVFSHEATGLEFVLVPGGTFVMGPSARAGAPSPPDTPHRVTLTRPYLIARTEWTNAAWDSVTHVARPRAGAPDLPVASVPWRDVNAFSRQAGLELPTEAQWEFACRAGTTTDYGFGDDERAIGDYGWCGEGGESPRHPVAARKPNAFGLYDVHGNVWEMCLDGRDAYPSGAVTDPPGPRDAEYRVVRGGSWDNPAGVAGSAYRGSCGPTDRSSNVGFRPVRNVAID